MRHKFVIFCGRRGCGKGTLVSAMLTQFPQLSRLPSHTTRPPRPTEIDRKHYHFVSVEQFDAMLQSGEIIGHFSMSPTLWYGLSRQVALQYRFAVTDLYISTALQAKELVQRNGGTAIIIGVYATPWQCRKRIQLRQSEISDDEVDRMIAHDPNKVEELLSCDCVVRNTIQGDPDFAIEQAVQIVERFLNGDGI